MEWVLTDFRSIALVVVSSVLAYMALVALTRLMGLRSFSKISSFDFALTVAFGSLLASIIISSDPPLGQGLTALATLFFIKWLVASARQRMRFARGIVDNDPLLLMARDQILSDNLKKAQITEDDLRAKLREANVLDLNQVRAVVMESTGDVSVLHGPADGPPLDLSLLREVRDAHRLSESA